MSSVRRILACAACLGLAAATSSARQTWLHVEEANLIGPDTGAGDRLGTAVASSGDTLLVGAPNAAPNEQGSAYVFVRANGGWTLQTKLVATIGTVGDFDHFGSSVALDGDVAVIGAPDWGTEDGHVHVFRRNGSTWTAEAMLGPPTEGYFYRFGAAVALSGTTLAASAPLFGSIHEGAVAIYEFTGGVWAFQAWLIQYAVQNDNRMGEGLALMPHSAGMRLIATSRTHGAEGFRRNGSTWSYWFSIGPGSNYFDAVAASSTTFALGESNATVGSAVLAGRVAVWSAGTSGPSFQGYATASDADPGDRFGSSVALEGDVLVAGAPFDDDATAVDGGAAYVFERAGSTWRQRAKVVASDAAPGDHFGRVVDVSGPSVVVGAPDHTSAAGALSGSTYALRIGYPTLTYCTAGPSSGGCVATMSSFGTPSASLSTSFTIRAGGVDGQREGILFYGVNGPIAAPWAASGFLCVRPPVQRTPSQSSGGTAGACDGVLQVNWNAFVFANPLALGQPFASGESVWAQGWFRDPASAKATQVSDALGFVLLP